MSIYFSAETFRFLTELAANNNREWFNANKSRYELVARQPFLQFIADFEPLLKQISPHLEANPSPTGGSLFRIYRDTRFSKDKSPYKTHLAAHFPRRDAGTAHSAPGYYLSIAPGECYGGGGVWQPEPKALGMVRDAIVRDPEGWSAVRGQLSDHGESLARPPKGYDPSHPFIDDLKWKNFVCGNRFTEEEVCSNGFLERYTAFCKEVSPSMAFLTRALGLEW